LGTEEVEFLGVTIGQGTVKISKKKTEAITNERPPTTRKSLRRFLGITNYHRKFIQGYSTIARPLHELMKDVPFDWTRDCQEAFEQLIKALTTAPVLALPANSGMFRLETDTSNLATGAILSQLQLDGSYRPVGYTSKSYNDAEKAYTTYDKEILGVMRGLEEWRSLLIGAVEPFKIWTDRRNLTYFQVPQKLMSRQVNWTTKLQDFNFTIQHVQGPSNARADALSRPDGVDKPEQKTATLLPDNLFVRLMVGVEQIKEEEPSKEEKGKIIKDYHDSPTAGHPGTKRTLNLLRR
jgi:hypothetical protein